MCVFVALWASKGVAGFMRTREGASKGGGGFICARKSSPRGAVSSRKRKKVRPARSKHPKFGVFVLAGRVFSRKSRWRGRAGRVFSRQLALRRSWMRCGALQAGCDGGFAPCEALWWRVAGVLEAWMASFPPIGGGEAALFDVRPAMSHVIPLGVFQALKACCWNCSACGASRKMTMLNYVRLWGP